MTATTAAPQAAPTEMSDRPRGRALADARAVRLDLAGRTRRLDAGCRPSSIQADLGMSTRSLQWLVSGMDRLSAASAARGRAADLLGRRKVFLVALAVFLVTSGIGGIANDGSVLIASRFLKGVAAAFTAPAGLSIITTSFAEGALRNRALAIYTATGGAGFSFGLVLGGVLTEISWRLVFLVPVVIAAATLAGGVAPDPRRCPRGPGSSGPRLRRREHHRSTPASRVHRRRSARAGWALPARCCRWSASPR